MTPSRRRNAAGLLVGVGVTLAMLSGCSDASVSSDRPSGVTSPVARMPEPAPTTAPATSAPAGSAAPLSLGDSTVVAQLEAGVGVARTDLADMSRFRAGDSYLCAIGNSTRTHRAGGTEVVADIGCGIVRPDSADDNGGSGGNGKVVTWATRRVAMSVAGSSLWTRITDLTVHGRARHPSALVPGPEQLVAIATARAAGRRNGHPTETERAVLDQLEAGVGIQRGFESGLWYYRHTLRRGDTYLCQLSIAGRAGPSEHYAVISCGTDRPGGSRWSRYGQMNWAINPAVLRFQGTGPTARLLEVQAPPHVGTPEYDALFPPAVQRELTRPRRLYPSASALQAIALALAGRTAG